MYWNMAYMQGYLLHEGIEDEFQFQPNYYSDQ